MVKDGLSAGHTRRGGEGVSEWEGKKVIRRELDFIQDNLISEATFC